LRDEVLPGDRRRVGDPAHWGPAVDAPVEDPGMFYAIHPDGWLTPEFYERNVVRYYPLTRSLGYYTPPSEGLPGQFVPHSWTIGQPNRYYETTPGFDAFVAARMEAAREAAAQGAAPIRDKGIGQPAAVPVARSAAVAPGAAPGRWQWWLALGGIGAGGAAGLAASLRRRGPFGHRG